MALTKVSNLTNAIQAKYMTGFLLAAERSEVWGKFVDWESIHEGAGGSSFDYLSLDAIDPSTAALPEDSDLVPTVLSDSNMVVTPDEYGGGIAPTRKARWQARGNLRTDGARLVGRHRTQVVDRLIRNGVMGGTGVRYPGAVTARTGLDATNDKATYDFLLQMEVDAQVAGIEPWDDGRFACPVHPALMRDIKQLTQFINPQYYRTDQESIFTGIQGEKVIFGGFTFISNPWGKIYLSGGTTAQAATTLSAAAAKGATSITVASATGIAAGDYLTLGTLEADLAEQVYVSAVSGTTITVVGGGKGANNLGLMYAHASGEAVTEAANVCAIPVIGRNSIKGVHGDETGRYGIVVLKEGLDTVNRFIYQSWYWYGGVGVWNKYVIRGEVAVSGGIRGAE